MFTPFLRGVETAGRVWPALSSARKTTLIFFSWTDDFSAWSTCCHCDCVRCVLYLWETWLSYDLGNVGELLIRSDCHRLHKELIATSCICGWLGFHGLQKDFCTTLVTAHSWCVELNKPETSTSLPGSILPELGLTQYL